MNRLIFLLAIITLGSNYSFGQETSVETTVVEDKKEKENPRASEVYKESGYMRYVDKISEGDQLSLESIVKLANSYRMNSKTAEAEYWYSRFIHENTEAIHFLHYAQVLQSNGKCEEAVKWFKEYKHTGKGEDISRRKFVENCDELSRIKIDEDVTLNNMTSINSSHLDFSAIPYDEGIVFTSTRGLDGASKNTDSWTNDNFSDLFIAKENNEGKIASAQPLLGSINAQFHDGTATFDNNKKVMIFTRNASRKNKKDRINLKLYMSTEDADSWSSPKELSINGKKFNTCHPTLSKDEKYLYFSSNRPGGFGGMDLYVSERLGGKWSEPINLGADVNTADNEIFPFISEDDILYFASNGHKGLGGLDVYRAGKSGTSWTSVENIGKPFNSESDDFGFITNLKNTKGYLSSNRKGGLGGDDIYSWSRDEEVLSRTICVTDAKTNDPIRNATVKIVEKLNKQVSGNSGEPTLKLKKVNGKDDEFVFAVSNNDDANHDKIITLQSDEVGQLKHQFQSDRHYEISIEKDGYVMLEESLNVDQLIGGQEHCFDLEELKCRESKIIVLDAVSKAMLPGAMVSIFDQNGKERKYALDNDGGLNTCVDANSNLNLGASHRGYTDARVVIPASAQTEGEDIIVYLNQGYQPAPASQPVYSAPPVYSPAPVYSTPPPAPSYSAMMDTKINELHEYFLGNGADKFRKNQIIELRDVYYDYDESRIRNDASQGLDHVVELLNAYPSMRIALRSHTDSRGKTYYNKYLSRKRAQKAMAYVISKGIAKHRLIYESFGETQLKNRCADGVDCSESEHQENRRTEIRITRLDNSNVEVKYQ